MTRIQCLYAGHFHFPMENNEVLVRLERIEQMLLQQNLLTKVVLTLEEACEYLGVSASQLYKQTSGRSIPFFKPTGKKLYFKRVDLDGWLLQNRSTTDDEIERMAADYIIQNKRRA